MTPDEVAILKRAQRDGYLVRSGQRLAVLLEWRRLCRQSGRPCVVAKLGARQAVIEVDGRDVAQADPADLEVTAYTMTKNSAVY